MIKFNCQKCGQAMKAAPEHAGKKTRCPQCQELVPIPLQGVASQPVMTAPPPRPAPSPRPAPPVMDVMAADAAPVAPRRRPRDDDDDDDDDDREDDRRPGRRRRKQRRGDYEDCPKCGSPGHATRVMWTWWGGLVGPMIINTVRCHDCGTSYNGNTGNYNTAAIAIYFGVTFGLAIIIVVMGILGNL
jgi:DNA-directed RNA polymerase subunit M/transcription elongation factor TFIIS